MFEGNRPYMWSVAAVLVGLLIAAFMLELNTEQRVRDIKTLATSQARKADVAEYVRLIVDAETAQRGYLLTEDPSYLQPYEHTRGSAPQLLDKISNDYLFEAADPPDDATRGDLNQLRELGGAKMDELVASLTLNSANRREAAIELVRTNVGKRTMDDLRVVAASLDDRENQRIESALSQWRSGIVASRAMLAGGTLLNIALLILVAYLLNRDLRRRESIAAQMEQHTQELEHLVHRRTAELSALSSHLQNVAEREKAAIARELHDELGGIMVAAKMDVTWLERRLTREGDDLALRWTRLRKLLDDGLNLKRRVVETLRPTLLDNMGLIPAVKWNYQETCARAGLKCTESYPEQELRLNDEASIAVFRVIQEATTNIIKHAKASEVALAMSLDDEHLYIEIRDNGVGIPTRQAARASHGLASMQHRITSFGGTWRISAPPSGGTKIEISLPLARILAPVAASA